MEYKEKWLSLKEEIESVVNCGLDCIREMDIKKLNRLIVYRNILDCMYKIVEDEFKTTNQKSINETVYDLVEEILDDLIFELADELSKNNH